MGFIQIGLAAFGTLAMSAPHRSRVYDLPIVLLGLTAAAVRVFVVTLATRWMATAWR